MVFLYPEYKKVLADLKKGMPNRNDEFIEKTKDWVVWELTTMPWGNQFDDIFDKNLTAESKATLQRTQDSL